MYLLGIDYFVSNFFDCFVVLVFNRTFFFLVIHLGEGFALRKWDRNLVNRITIQIKPRAGKLCCNKCYAVHTF